ncbi:hypothetical protein K502DRAFT_368002 [Neoconidiobolus thromboides FSU 785]|nr:hypothetical protein K502DRAFT_368002 [Neoconidiobolus thromboides FSU 785]
MKVQSKGASKFNNKGNSKAGNKFNNKSNPKGGFNGKGAKKYNKKPEEIEEIKFDETSRKEYLTGFHKRNVEKKKQAEIKAKERERVEKLELRKETRKMRLKELGQRIKVEDIDRQLLTDIQSSKEKLSDQEMNFDGEKETTTVTLIQDFEKEMDDEMTPAIMLKNIKDKARKAGEEESDHQEDSEDSDKESGNKFKKNRKQKIKYETKFERKKQQKNKKFKK